MNWKREQVLALEMFVVQVVQVVFPLLIVVWSTCLFSCPPEFYITDDKGDDDGAEVDGG